MVIGAVFLIDIIRRHIRGIESVPAYAALKTTSRLVRDGPQELHLLYQVFDCLVNVGESAYLLTRELTDSGGKVLEFRRQSHFIGLCRGIDMGNERGMRSDVLDRLPVVIDNVALFLETPHVIVFSPDLHCLHLFSVVDPLHAREGPHRLLRTPRARRGATHPWDTPSGIRK